MIIKSSNLLYLFDFDGTLAGIDGWVGWISGVKSVLKKCHFNPGIMDVRWSILTARPRIDYPLVKYACFKHKLKPQEIFMSDTYLYHFKNLEDEMKYKYSFMKSILDKKLKLDFAIRPINKIFYVDNNKEATKILNGMRGSLDYLALSVSDLYNQNFTSLLI